MNVLPGTPVDLIFVLPKATNNTQVEWTSLHNLYLQVDIYRKNLTGEYVTYYVPPIKVLGRNRETYTSLSFDEFVATDNQVPLNYSAFFCKGVSSRFVESLFTRKNDLVPISSRILINNGVHSLFSVTSGNSADENISGVGLQSTRTTLTNDDDVLSKIKYKKATMNNEGEIGFRFDTIGPEGTSFSFKLMSFHCSSTGNPNSYPPIVIGENYINISSNATNYSYISG